jgi:hypothetical protein
LTIAMLWRAGTWLPPLGEPESGPGPDGATVVAALVPLALVAIAIASVRDARQRRGPSLSFVGLVVVLWASGILLPRSVETTGWLRGEHHPEPSAPGEGPPFGGDDYTQMIGLDITWWLVGLGALLVGLGIVASLVATPRTDAGRTPLPVLLQVWMAAVAAAAFIISINGAELAGMGVRVMS